MPTIDVSAEEDTHPGEFSVTNDPSSSSSSSIAAHSGEVEVPGSELPSAPASPRNIADGDDSRTNRHDNIDCLVDPQADVDLHEKWSSFSHHDWAREQSAEPVCRATILYLSRNCPRPFPTAEILRPVGQRRAPTQDEVVELARKGSSYVDEDDLVLSVRKPTSADRSTHR